MSKELSDLIIKGLQEKKAKDIVRIFVGNKTILADYFVICDCPSQTQVKALCEHIEFVAEQNGYTVLRKEGVTEGKWAVVDFGEVICHIFNTDARDFYRIERLWEDESNIEHFAD